jgi:hypothetical protein
MGITVDVYRNYIARAVAHLDPGDSTTFLEALSGAESHILSTIKGLNLPEDQKTEQVALLNTALLDFRQLADLASPPDVPALSDADSSTPAATPELTGSTGKDPQVTADAAPPVVLSARREPAPPVPEPGPSLPRRLFAGLTMALAGAAIVLGYQAFFQSDCRAFSCHDSGWRMLEGRADHVLTVDHGLGVPPVGVEIWFSPDEGKTFMRRHAASWTHSINPVDMRADAQTVSLHFYRGEPLHKVWTLADGWVSYDRGYFRVITRR